MCVFLCAGEKEVRNGGERRGCETWSQQIQCEAADRLCGSEPGLGLQGATPTPLFEPAALSSWSFYQAGIAEFIATFLYLYITVLTVMGVSKSPSKCVSVGTRNSRHCLGFWWHDLCPCLLHSQHLRDKQRPCNFLLAFILSPFKRAAREIKCVPVRHSRI